MRLVAELGDAAALNGMCVAGDRLVVVGSAEEGAGPMALFVDVGRGTVARAFGEAGEFYGCAALGDAVLAYGSEEPGMGLYALLDAARGVSALRRVRGVPVAAAAHGGRAYALVAPLEEPYRVERLDPSLNVTATFNTGVEEPFGQGMTGEVGLAVDAARGRVWAFLSFDYHVHLRDDGHDEAGVEYYTESHIYVLDGDLGLVSRAYLEDEFVTGIAVGADGRTYVKTPSHIVVLAPEGFPTVKERTGDCARLVDVSGEMYLVCRDRLCRYGPWYAGDCVHFPGDAARSVAPADGRVYVLAADRNAYAVYEVALRRL